MMITLSTFSSSDYLPKKSQTKTKLTDSQKKARNKSKKAKAAIAKASRKINRRKSK